MYCIVQQGGRQHKVAQGDIIRIARIEQEPGSEVILDNVVLLHSDDAVQTLREQLQDVKVHGTVQGHGYKRKVRVMKKQPRKRYQRTKGFREAYTTVKIEKIVAS
jgi:large subunit ribosomal protein L21